MRSPVLVVTCLDDSTADLVLAELYERDVPVVRFDPAAEFPARSRLNVRFTEQGMNGCVVTETRRVDLAEVRSVYWRKPTPYRSPSHLDEQAGHWVAEQSRYGLGGVLASLSGTRYLNHPWRNRDAEYKPAQLATAVDCGLEIPPTVITNSLDVVKRFAADVGAMVYKPLWSTPYRDQDGVARAIWTRPVDIAEVDDRISEAAHLFQQLVVKEADVRVTMVGDRIFAVRIDGAAGLDWRQDYEPLSYRLIEPPPVIARRMRAYLDRFGLVFGAFDFALTPAGEWIFLECNPNGQWAWFPEDITRRIAHAVADHLQHPEGRP